MSEPTVDNERSPRLPGLDAEATPLLGIGIGLTGLALGLRPRLAPLPLALTALTALLYRDPERVTPQDTAALFAVADGVVTQLDEIYEHRFLHTDSLRLVTMQTPIDVSVNRSPAAGQVRFIKHVEGDFRPVWDAEAAERNTRTYIGLDTVFGPVLVVQIAGPVSRRIISKVAVGDQLTAGERIGIIRFGARTDLLFQRDSFRTLLRAGQRVTAGITALAEAAPL